MRGRAHASRDRKGEDGLLLIAVDRQPRPDVDELCPGSVDTDMMRGTSPRGRRGLSSGIGAAVAFLTPGPASFITGPTLNVNGGMRMD